MMNNTDQLDTFIKEVTQEIKIEDIIKNAPITISDFFMLENSLN